MNQLDVFRENFGGYVLAGAVVLVEYSALTVFAPNLATPLAMVTLFAIIIFYFRKRAGAGGPGSSSHTQ